MRKSQDAFRTISEVAQELDLPQHVLRFWETRFSQIKPMKRGGGRRYYRPDDVELLRGIRHLLYGEGYTIKGVQRILKEQGVRHVIDAVSGGETPEPELAAGTSTEHTEPSQVEIERPPLVQPPQKPSVQAEAAFAQAEPTPAVNVSPPAPIQAEPIAQPQVQSPLAAATPASGNVPASAPVQHAPLQAPVAARQARPVAASPMQPQQSMAQQQSNAQQQAVHDGARPHMSAQLAQQQAAGPNVGPNLQATAPQVQAQDQFVAQTGVLAAQTVLPQAENRQHSPSSFPVPPPLGDEGAFPKPADPQPEEQELGQSLPSGLSRGEPRYIQGEDASISVQAGQARLAEEQERTGFFSKLRNRATQDTQSFPEQDAKSLGRDDIRRLQSTLFELLECKRILDHARNDD